MSARLCMILLATSALVPLGAQANPLDANVVAGSATVSGENTRSVTVHQTTDKAILNWRSFDIGADESTTFVQPGADSVALKRVTGNLGPTEILGRLSANGKLFVINPDGVLFGEGAVVDTASLLATTSDIADADFMAGRYRFDVPGAPDASIVNLGTINASNGGFAALVAPGVRNDGIITARLGQVGLAAANDFSLDFYGDRLITLAVGDEIGAAAIDLATGMPLDALVKNEGTLSAEGGTVQLTAATARAVVDSVINNEGVIEANSVGLRNGKIVLGAQTADTKQADAPVQRLRVSGNLSASGDRQGETGGSIWITGEQIDLIAASIVASGIAGGGTVLVGGDVGGGSPRAAAADIAKAALEATPIATAANVSVDAESSIDASAVKAGDGGKIVVWADGSTTFKGHAAARGGARAGAGGFIETSGHEQLSYDGSVDLLAPNGANGTLLLDPLNVQIGGAPGTQTLSVAALQNALASGNVVVTTGATGTEAGDITVAESVSWVNGSDLTLEAFRDIDVLGGVVVANTGAGDLNLRADATGIGIGNVEFAAGGQIDWDGSTGNVSIFYNPALGYAAPVNYAPAVLTNAGVPDQLTAYMLVNDVFDLQNINQNLAGTYALGGDIDASVTAAWNVGEGFISIGSYSAPFEGQFKGLGRTIDSLYINRSEAFQGLFGATSVGSLVDGVSLTNANVTNQLLQGAGALVGLNSGTVSNSYSSGIVKGADTVGGLVGGNLGTVASSSSNAQVEGTQAGGLVGVNARFRADNGDMLTGLIIDSFATGSVSNGLLIGGLVGANVYGALIKRSFAAGPVTTPSSGGYIAGGLVGFNEGEIDESYATSDVSGGTLAGLTSSTQIGGLVGWNSNVSDPSASLLPATIRNSYSTGNVSGYSRVGGLVGLAGEENLGGRSGQIISSYAVGAVIGTLDVGGLLGFSGTAAAEIQVLNSYWDTEATGQSNSYAGNGRTTAQLKSGLPPGFDPTVWGSNPSINNGNPYLLWQAATPPPPPIATALFAPPFTVEPPPPPPAATIATPSDPSGSQQTGLNFGPETRAQSDDPKAPTTSNGTTSSLAGRRKEISSLSPSSDVALGKDGKLHATILEALDSVTIIILGKQISLSAYANVKREANGEIVKNMSGEFQCTALVKRYLIQLGLDVAVRDNPVGKGLDVVRTLSSKEAFKGYFDVSYSGELGAKAPSIGSIVSMETNEPAGHVAIIKSLEAIGETLVATLIEENMSTYETTSFAVDRTIVFSKNADGNWVAGKHVMVSGGPERSVVGWATPVSSTTVQVAGRE